MLEALMGMWMEAAGSGWALAIDVDVAALC
jgi:hypothetical protein